MLRATFARLCRHHRLQLRLSQDELGRRVGVSRGHIGRIENGKTNPSLDLVERMGRALDVDFTLVAHAPTIVGAARQHDLVHARCSGYAERRLRTARWLTAREVEIVHGAVGMAGSTCSRSTPDRAR